MEMKIYIDICDFNIGAVSSSAQPDEDKELSTEEFDIEIDSAEEIEERIIEKDTA